MDTSREFGYVDIPKHPSNEKLEWVTRPIRAWRLIIPILDTPRWIGLAKDIRDAIDSCQEKTPHVNIENNNLAVAVNGDEHEIADKAHARIKKELTADGPENSR